jgi:hypothetical protein
MRDSRIGETLWSEWSGEGFEPTSQDALVFFTEDHVDIENETVRRALASALQRDGSSISLGNGYSAIESATVSHGYAGEVDEAIYFTMCNEDGETRDGDYVDRVIPITWVEI